MHDCIFCRIVKGDAPASVVYRDATCMAFVDIQPVNPGHTLVIPIDHASGLSDLDEDVGAQMFRVGQRVATALRRTGIPCEGVNMFLADGEAAMQEVFHVHLHVFPRFKGDGFGLTFPPDYTELPDRGELDGIAAGIARSMPADGATGG